MLYIEGKKHTGLAPKLVWMAPFCEKSFVGSIISQIKLKKILTKLDLAVTLPSARHYQDRAKTGPFSIRINVGCSGSS